MLGEMYTFILLQSGRAALALRRGPGLRVAQGRFGPAGYDSVLRFARYPQMVYIFLLLAVLAVSFVIIYRASVIKTFIYKVEGDFRP